MLRPVIAVSLGLLVLVSATRAETVEALLLLGHNYGANYNLVRDKLDEFGWHSTVAGLTEVVQPCPSYAGALGCPPITADIRFTDLTDFSSYDCLIIMSSSHFAGNPWSDILGNQEALNLVAQAWNEGLVVAAWCTGVRVLAAADIIDGVQVTGNPNYQAEYEAAGAIYLGPQIPPVTDSSIVTCTRGQYYNIQNCEAVAAAVENTERQARQKGGVEP